MSDYGPMTAREWSEVFAKLPEPSLEELARFMERRRAEFAEEMREFDGKWEGRTLKVNTEARRRGECL